MLLRCWFRLFYGYLKKGKDRMAVFDFVSAWVSVGRKTCNLEFVCMDASLDVGGCTLQ